MITAFGKTAFVGLTASLAASLMMSASALAQGVDVGVNAAVRNQVTLQSDGTAARPAVPAETVFLGDSVVSGADSALQILLKDETVFTVGANVDMTIDEFVYDPSAQTGSLAATVKKGAFRFMSGKIAQANPDDVTLVTPTANIGVRGTVLDVVVGEDALAAARQSGIDTTGAAAAGDGATLVVLRGPGREQSGLNKDGGASVTTGGNTVTLWKSGTAVFVPRSGGQVFGPFRFDDSLFFSVAGDVGTQVTGDSQRPPRDLRPVIRDVPDLRDLRRPGPPGGPGRGPCPGECPNNQEDAFGGDTGSNF
ncbi:FecR domain-containing protein [Parvularcula sp. IMCC14364]|uniref:FecR family protein n=1 Tax=Parvularcula sp. IMCC14364 TaxID=3067902 RepID=UPI002740C664|nr:FecR domain-containing protein [Parvularcula sp. IMCC14364]